MRKRFIASFIVLFALFAPLTPTLAQVDCSGPQSNSAYCTGSQVSGNPLFGTNGVVTKTVQLLTIATGVLSVFMMVYGGLRFVLSGGDPQKINQARNTILYAAIGIAISLLAQAIIIFILNNV